MLQDVNKVWKDKNTRQLADVLVSISNKDMMQNFLRDVMTEKEIVEISARFEAALMLTEGIKYTDIVAKTKLSSRTVARISEWMKNGSKGYGAAIDMLNQGHTHNPPVRAD